MWVAIILAYALSALVPQQAALPKQIDLHWVYMKEGLKWEAPPKGTTEGVKYSDNGFLAVFYPSGEYVGVFPVLYRDDKTKHISISRGDGMVIRKGRWTKLTNDSIRVVSSIVYTPVPQVGKQYPSDQQEDDWQLSGAVKGRLASKIRTPKATLVPADSFTDLEFLSNYIAAEASGGGPMPTTR